MNKRRLLKLADLLEAHAGFVDELHRVAPALKIGAHGSAGGGSVEGGDAVTYFAHGSSPFLHMSLVRTKLKGA